MSTLRIWLTEPHRTARLSCWYWLLSAVAYAAFVGLTLSGAAVSLSEYATASPSAALGAAHAALTALFAGLLVAAERSTGWLRIIACCAAVQQVLAFNLPGAILAGALIVGATRNPTRAQPRVPGPILAAALIVLGLALALVATAEVRLLTAAG